jgi:hypothetical protein
MKFIIVSCITTHISLRSKLNSDTILCFLLNSNNANIDCIFPVHRSYQPINFRHEILQEETAFHRQPDRQMASPSEVDKGRRHFHAFGPGRCPLLGALVTVSEDEIEISEPGQSV